MGGSAAACFTMVNKQNLGHPAEQAVGITSSTATLLQLDQLLCFTASGVEVKVYGSITKNHCSFLGVEQAIHHLSIKISWK